MDVNEDDKTLEVYTNLEDLEGVRTALEGMGLAIETAERAMVPKTSVQLDEAKATQVMRMVERLEDLDDIQNVSTNLDLSDEMVAALAS